MTRFNASAHISCFFLFFARWRSEIILPLVFRFFLRRISLLGYKRHFARIPSAILIIFSIVSRNATFSIQVSIEFVFCCSCDLATDVLTYISLQLTPVPLNRSFRIARIFLDEISFTHRRYACAQHSSFFFFFLTIRNDNCICIYAIALKIYQIYTVLRRSRHLRYTVGETRHIDE